MFTFSKNYFIITVLLFVIEVCIALFVHDRFIRPYLGDVLVVILIYCFVKTFLKVTVLKAALGVLLFSFGIELLQYANIIEILGWQDNKLARTVIGTSFAREDLVAYVAGILLVIVVEKGLRKIV